jgi:uncharacterized protein (DUF1800 family)
MARVSVVLVLLAVAASAARADQAPLTHRMHVQHMLRRFAFAASPEATDAIADVTGGGLAWLDRQLDPAGIDDAGSTLETLPTTLNADGGLDDPQVFERVILQHWVLTHRQVQAKLELHWLDHFSVSLNKVGDWAVMNHYDHVLRQNALGNFTDLVTAVAKEVAMMSWLDNDGNIGPVANENFARECMQLFVMGPYKLNQDGSVRTDANGVPLPNYSQDDVQSVALAMTGYHIYYAWSDPDPQTRFSVFFAPGDHDPRPLVFHGKNHAVPDDAHAIRYVMDLLTHNPSTAPFQAKELLQRFVTETPSPKYISDIAAVWAAAVDAPDQIAQVVRAIVTHPEFDLGYHAMLKQPVELIADMMRQLPGKLQASDGYGPATSLLWVLSDLGQEPFFPPSVFSFYRPGQISTMVNTSTRLNRSDDLAWIASSAATDDNVTAYIDIAALRQRIGSTKAGPIADYLLDALLDGGSPALRQILVTYLKASNGTDPGDDQIRGALWLLLNAPDYAVN